MERTGQAYLYIGDRGSDTSKAGAIMVSVVLSEVHGGRPLLLDYLSFKIATLALAITFFISSINIGRCLDQGSPPNIILILADDLGYGDLGCYGQTQIQTPCLDRMAAEGMRFTQFYAGSTVCAPSRCVLLTGLNTGHCRVRGNARVPLLPQDETVAEMLQRAGYANAIIGKWGLEGCASRRGPSARIVQS